MRSDHDSLIGKLDGLFAGLPSDRDAADSYGRVQKVAHYNLGRVLGGGGFGVVYLAEDTRLKRLVALKLPRIEALFDNEKRSRFTAEAIAAARLNHPRIVRIYDAELDGMMPFIASEFCDGPSLGQWLDAAEEPPPWRDCLSLVADIADAVHYAHQNKVFHRDLKPANIMLTLETVEHEENSTSQTELNSKSDAVSDVPLDWRLCDCEAKLTDFGLAKLVDFTITETRSSRLLGTPLYMAPEQLEQGFQEELSPAIDVYSLGVILFELLTSHLPIQGSSYVNAIDNIRTMTPKRIGEFRKGIPRDVEIICAKCLEKNPAARYSTARDLADDLQRCLLGTPLKRKKVGLLSRFQWWCTRSQRVANAGWFAISWVSMLALWMTFNILALPAHVAVEEGALVSGLKDLGILMVGGVIPNLWLGWKVVQSKTWALWMLTLYSLVRIPFLVRAMVSEPVYFAMIYKGNALFSFVDHSMIVIATCTQLFLCVCGLLAKRKMVG